MSWCALPKDVTRTERSGTSGYPPAHRAGPVRDAVAQLRAVARRQKTIGYQALAQALGIEIDTTAGRRELADILRDISTAEVAGGRPMLSAVVVFRSRGTPGQGFFAVAEALGRFDGLAPTEFFDEELRRVHAYWADRANRADQ